MTTSSTCIKSSGYKTAARIYIHCEIQAVPFLRPFGSKRAKLERAELSQMKPGEPSAAIRERVIRARNIQSERMLHQFAEPDAASLDMLRMAMERLSCQQEPIAEF